MSLIVRCPLCKTNNEMEEAILENPTIECPSCQQVSYREDFSVMTFCPHCHQKLAIPVEMLYEDEILCVTCDKPFKPNSSFSLAQDDLDNDDTIYQEVPEPKQLYQAGDFFDKYEIISLLGRGGMGEVYLAKHLLLNKKVAIKIMLAKNADKNPVAAKRFIREAKLANKIQSPNIIGVFDVGVEQKEKHLFIAMEYVDGLTLNQIMHERGPFSEIETLTIAKEVCNALLIMEENNIVHRDIKPSNIMINSQQVVKLADLGIAKADSSSIEGELTLTVDNLVFGTPNYASPEQCRSSHDTDSRSDIYSLGATMFHMVAGVPPFDGVTPMDTMFKVINEPPLDITTKVPHISTRFKALLNYMLAKEPTSRPQTIGELTTIIDDLLNDLETSQVTPNAPSLAEVTSDNYRTSLTSFLKKIDRLKTLTNFSTVNEKFSKSIKIIKITAKIVAIIIIMIGIISAISLYLGTGLTKELFGISSNNSHKQTSYKPNSTYQINTAKNKVYQRRTYNKLQTTASNSSSPSPTKNKTTPNNQSFSTSKIYCLTPQEFNNEYEKIFFGNDQEINSPKAFSTIENRLKRSKKILSSPILAKYKDKDYRFKDIYNHHLNLVIKLSKQLDTYKNRIAANKNRNYSKEKTNNLVKIANELYSTKNKDWNKYTKLSKEIVALLEDMEVNPNAEITIPLKEWYYISYIKNKNLSVEHGRTHLTLPLPEFVLDDTVTFFSYNFPIYKALLKREITPQYVIGTRLNEYINLGINNFSDKLSNTITFSKYQSKNILSNGDNPNQVTKKGEYLLHLAVKLRDIQIVQLALYNGVKVNYVNVNNETALFNAMRYSTKEIKDLLIAYGANTYIVNNNSQRANDNEIIGKFNNAVTQKNYSLIKKIITPELAKLPLYNNASPLLHAIETRDLSLLKILLTQKLNLNEKYISYYHGSYKMSPLRYLLDRASSNPSFHRHKDIAAIIATLFEHGANLFSSTEEYQYFMSLYLRNKKSWLYKTILKNVDFNRHLPNFFEIALSKKRHNFNTTQAKETFDLFYTIIQHQKIDFNNPIYNEKLPKLLGSLRVNEHYLNLVISKGYKLDTVDSNNKNVLDYYIKNIAILFNLTNEEISDIDKLLTNDSMYSSYYPKYRYLRDSNLTFDKYNLFSNNSSNNNSSNNNSSSNNSSESVNKNSYRSSSKEPVDLLDIAKEEILTFQEVNVANTFIKFHKDIFAEVNSSDNFISTKARLARTRKILNYHTPKKYSKNNPIISRLYSFHNSVAYRLARQIRNKEKRLMEMNKKRYNKQESHKLKLFIEKYLKERNSYRYQNRKNFYKELVAMLEKKYIDPYIKIKVSGSLYYRIKGQSGIFSKEEKEVSLVEAILCLADYNYWNENVIATMMKKLIIYPETTPLYLLAQLSYNDPEISIENFKKQILYAAKFRRNSIFEFLLRNGDNVNQQDDDGNTVLHWLVRNRSQKIEYAIYAGANINQPNKEGETPYFWAVKYGTKEERAILLRHGANPNLKNNAGKIANNYNYVATFNNALEKKDLDVIKSLLANYPSLANEFLPNRYSPIGFAIANKNIELLELLLNHKANPNIYLQGYESSSLAILWQQYNRSLYGLQQNLKEDIIEMFNLLASNGGDISFTRYSRHGIPVIFELHCKENLSINERRIYNILINNFKTNIHLVPLLREIYYPINQTYSYYSDYKFHMNKKNKLNNFLKYLLNKSTRISNKNSIIKENMPQILGSLKVGLDVIKTLENAGLNLQITDSKNKNILDYFCMYFEKTNENLAYIQNTNNNQFNYRNRTTAGDKYREKIRYLRSRGLRVNKSKYNIHDNIWKSWK